MKREPEEQTGAHNLIKTNQQSAAEHGHSKNKQDDEVDDDDDNCDDVIRGSCSPPEMCVCLCVRVCLGNELERE